MSTHNMPSLLVHAACWFVILPSTVAPTHTLSPLDAFGSLLPPCAIECLIQALPNCTDVSLNLPCLYKNPLVVEFHTCVQDNCTVVDSLGTQNVTSTACDIPVRNRQTLYLDTTFVAGGISAAAVLLRLLSRYLTKTKFDLDDCAILLGMALGIVGNALAVHGLIHNGLGKDIWTLPPRNISDMLHVFYAEELLYFLELSLVKISFLFFYLRLFPAKKFRRIIYFTISIILVLTAMFEFTALFQCQPINHFWKIWGGTCHHHNNILAWANGGFNIAGDVWLVALPAKSLHELQLPLKKKVGVGIMLGIGGVVTIVSCIRLSSLLALAKSANPTYDYVPVGAWSTIEVNVGLICSCLPALKHLVLHVGLWVEVLRISSAAKAVVPVSLRTRCGGGNGHDMNRVSGINADVRDPIDDSSMIGLANRGQAMGKS